MHKYICISFLYMYAFLFSCIADIFTYIYACMYVSVWFVLRIINTCFFYMYVCMYVYKYILNYLLLGLSNIFWSRAQLQLLLHFDNFTRLFIFVFFSFCVYICFFSLGFTFLITKRFKMFSLVFFHCLCFFLVSLLCGLLIEFLLIFYADY